MEVHPGDRLRLVEMNGDPNPIEVGTEGEVTSVTDLTSYDGTTQIGMRWDNGRTLALIAPHDKFEIIGPRASMAA